MGRVAIALLSTLLFLCSWTAVAWGQVPLELLSQTRDGDLVNSLSGAERSELGDPLFNLVLRDHADVVELAAIEERLRGDTGTESTFVVGETIANSTAEVGNRPAVRRSVLAFSGSNQGEDLTANVMLSVDFTSEGYGERPDIEAWGWDQERGRYNYYKLDRQGTPGQLSWKFRGSSNGADQLSADQRFNTCFQCHINGGPVMKELVLPWNNWRSSNFQADYLQSQWPVGETPRMGDRLGIADDLEQGLIVPALKRFNQSWITAHLVTDDQGQPLTTADGTQQVTAAATLLRPLFETTEFNLISSTEQTSGLHPFSEFEVEGPFLDFTIPSSFFLNAKLLGGNPPNQINGLQLAEAFNFGTVTRVTPAEYQQLVKDSGVQLAGQAGDTNFAWFVPEASQIDTDRVDQLMNRGIVTPAFVAATMAIDLETPLLSADRADLRQFLPDQFGFQPLPPGRSPLAQARHPDALTQAVIANLEAANPAPESPAGQWLTLLQGDDPIAALRSQIIAYRDRLDARLNQGDAATRQAELQRLFEGAIAKRQAIKADPTLRSLDEFGLLFPLPTE